MTKLALTCVLLATILLATTCADMNVVHVDKSNTTAPWDGTAQNPYQTIQQGLNAAQAGGAYIVEVHGGVYNENVVMKPGTVLRQASGATTTVIQGKPGSPTIVAKDRCGVAALVVEGGSVGIQIVLDATEPGAQDQDRWTSVANCRIHSTDGIWVKTPANLAFGAGKRRKPRLYISDNWIQPGPGVSGGTGIRLELTGPKSGELSILLDVTGNVIQQKQTGMDVHAKGQGTNPGGVVRAQFTGVIENNLIFYGHTGIRLHSEDLGSASPTLFNNTIVDNTSHAIVARATAGSDGGASTHPDVVNNLLARNTGHGYLEFSPQTSAKDLNHNLFYQNAQGHYFDDETSKTIDSQKGLNTPIVDGKVVFVSGSGNLVADPRFAKGEFCWYGKGRGQIKAGEYYLTQSGSSKSPALDAGLGSAQDAGLHLLSTSTDFTLDGGTVDLGFHYTKPWATP